MAATAAVMERAAPLEGSEEDTGASVVVVG